MFDVEIDKSKNLLKLKFALNFTAEEAKQWLEKTRVYLSRLKPGFFILTDISTLDNMDYAAGKYIDSIMDACNKKGVSKVVRIIPDKRKDIGFNIMSIFHYKSNVQIVNCETVDEALKHLP